MAMEEPTRRESPQIASAFETLCRQYAGKLPQRIEEMCAVAEAAEAGGKDAFERARVIAHRLHGTAGSYGFGAVSEIAGELEELFERADHDATHWLAVHDCVARLRSLQPKATP